MPKKALAEALIKALASIPKGDSSTPLWQQQLELRGGTDSIDLELKSTNGEVWSTALSAGLFKELEEWSIQTPLPVLEEAYADLSEKSIYDLIQHIGPTAKTASGKRLLIGRFGDDDQLRFITEVISPKHKQIDKEIGCTRICQ